MRNRIFVVLWLCVVFALALPSSAAPRPNILVIYSDDHGWADLGANGVDKEIRTPHLDQLAQDGVRFTRGYVTAPQCVPSRAGLLTGRYQQKFGVEDNNKGPLPLAETSLAERLQAAGYRTGQVGKWHLDMSGKETGARLQKEFMPHAHGFDEYWRGEMRQFYASHDLKGQPLAGAPQLVSDGRFRIAVQTEAALAFLKRREATPAQPWFLYLAYYAPHVPLESPEPWFLKTPAHLPKERRQALAMIAAMDEGVGQLRAKLKAMGAEQNTLIFFVGDNGAPLKTGAWNGSLNLPLIGEKGMLTDGGMRVPFVVTWPSQIAPGQVYEKPVSALDVAATAAAVTNAESKINETKINEINLDGVNLLPFVTGQNKNAPHEALFWRWRSQAAVLEFPWKFIHLGGKARYLFDVTQPAGETKNLLAQHPDVAARLEAKLTTWSQSLQPPGLPSAAVPPDVGFFAEHVDKTLAALTPAAPAVPGAVQGWLARNGTLILQDGALRLSRAEGQNGRYFLTNSALDVPGPVQVMLRVRAVRGGAATLTWRSKADADFLPANSVAFEWPATQNWQEIKTTLPVVGSLVHLRLTPAKDSESVELQAIEMQGRDGKTQSWRFDGLN